MPDTTALTAPRSPARRTTAFAVLICLLATGPTGCLTTRLPAIGQEGPFALERDEREMWQEATEEERKLRDKMKIRDDPLLDDYLSRVARSVVPAEARSEELLKVRVSTIQDPSLNAFTYPTGSIYIHTGLLARLENESQLATVLGHEAAHATGRHALRFRRSARNKAIGFSIASLVGSIAVATAAGRKAEAGDYSTAYVLNQVGNIMVALGMQLAFLAAVHGFGRDLEREADRVGVNSMVAAGYDPREAPRVFEILKDDHGDDRKLEVFFFGSHPRLDERIESTRELIAAQYAGAPGGEAASDPREFRMRTRVLVRENAAMNLEAGRLGVAEAELQKVLDLTPNDAVAHYLYGQLLEARAAGAKEPGETEALRAEAADRYREASRLDPSYAEPLFAIGVLRHRAGDKAAALEAFRRYLAIRPDGPRSRQAKDYILELEAS